MKPLIIVVQNDPYDVLVFDSLEYAQGYIEPIDVENGEYRNIYDSEGRLLRFVIESERAFLFARRQLTRIVRAEQKPSHEDQLRRDLVAYMLLYSGLKKEDVDNLAFKDLVSRVVERKLGKT